MKLFQKAKIALVAFIFLLLTAQHSFPQSYNLLQQARFVTAASRAPLVTFAQTLDASPMYKVIADIVRISDSSLAIYNMSDRSPRNIMYSAFWLIRDIIDIAMQANKSALALQNAKNDTDELFDTFKDFALPTAEGCAAFYAALQTESANIRKAESLLSLVRTVEEVFNSPKSSHQQKIWGATAVGHILLTIYELTKTDEQAPPPGQIVWEQVEHERLDRDVIRQIHNGIGLNRPDRLVHATLGDNENLGTRLDNLIAQQHITRHQATIFMLHHMALGTLLNDNFRRNIIRGANTNESFADIVTNLTTQFEAERTLGLQAIAANPDNAIRSWLRPHGLGEPGHDDILRRLLTGRVHAIDSRDIPEQNGQRRRALAQVARELGSRTVFDLQRHNYNSPIVTVNDNSQRPQPEIHRQILIELYDPTEQDIVELIRDFNMDAQRRSQFMHEINVLRNQLRDDIISRSEVIEIIRLWAAHCVHNNILTENELGQLDRALPDLFCNRPADTRRRVRFHLTASQQAHQSQ